MLTNPLEKPGKVTGRTLSAVVQNYPEPLYDLGALKDISSGNHEFTISLVKIFLDTIPANSAEMVQASADGNWIMVSKLAHKLKSTIDMMRIKSIAQDIRILELDGKSNVSKDNLPALARKVNVVILKASNQLREEFDL